MDRSDCSFAARLALAHGTRVAKERDATVFLWTHDELLGCFNGEALGCFKGVTVEKLLHFIWRCASRIITTKYKLNAEDYKIAMAPVKLEPYNTDINHSKAIRCRPVLPPYGLELCGNEDVSQLRLQDYIVFFKEKRSGENIYQPEPEAIDPISTERGMLFRSLQLGRAPSFFARNSVISEVTDTLKFEANHLPHNNASLRCVVTGFQTGHAEGQDKAVQLGWIYPPELSEYHKGPRAALLTEYWKHGREAFKVPENLIAMRKDIYDLFFRHAFGIDMDRKPPQIYIFDSSHSDVRTKLPKYLTVEVHDKIAKALLQDHLLECFFSGVFGGDVKDQLDCSEDNMQNMLDTLPAPLPDAEEWPQDPRWNTEMGNALKEWVLYQKGQEDGGEED